jgi:hypothetical protein
MVIFQEFLQKFLEIFIDDFCVFSSEKDPMEHLRLTFEKCRESGLCLHPKMCFFGMQQGVLLGHVVSSKGIEVDKDKIQCIAKLQVPRDTSELMAFFGHTGYYCRFILMYAAICLPLTALLKKDVQYAWNPERQTTFELLKEKLVTAPVLLPPDWNGIRSGDARFSLGGSP